MLSHNVHWNALLFYIVYIVTFIFSATRKILVLLARTAEEVANTYDSLLNSHLEMTQIMMNNHLPSCLAMKFKVKIG